MTKSAWAGLIFVFALGAAARLGWVAVRHGPAPEMLAYPDEYAYQLAGRSLAGGQGLIDEFGYRATYMPAYPAFIAAFDRLGAPMLVLRLVQAALAALVAPATFLLAREWFSAVRRALAPTTAPTQQFAERAGRAGLIVPVLAGLAAAFDPFLVFFSGLLLTEALYAVALVTTWWLVLRLVCKGESPVTGLAAAAGVSLLACVMLRPSSVILIPIVPAVVVLWRGFGVRTFLMAAVVVLVAVVGLLPWAARNAAVLGEWRWTTTRGGISLYDGLQTGAAGASDLAHTKKDPRAQGLPELEWDQYWHDRAVQVLHNHPGAVLRVAARKLGRTWNIVPNEPGHRRGAAAAVSAVWMLVVLASAAAGLWRVRRAVRWWLILCLPVLAFTLLHMIFVGSVRYRVPFMPLVFVLSAVGVARMAVGQPPVEASECPPEDACGGKEGSPA